MNPPRRTRITNAHIVLPRDGRASNLLIEDDTILAIDPPPTAHADATFDAAGRYLLPGVVDSHVHFREPGLTHKEDLATGSRAAAKGGVTSFIDMPNTLPPASNQAEIDRKHALAERASLVNYGFYIAATTGNLGDLKTAERVAGIKIFIGSSTGNLLVDDQDTLEHIFAETTLPICAHCEDESTVRANAQRLAEQGFPNGHADHSNVRDPAAAARATQRAVDLAQRHDHRFHVLHVSTADELSLVRAARGVVTGEACPHHLFLDTSDYDRLGARAQVNPSLKTSQDRAALWSALEDGTLAAVVTDHAPHTAAEKAAPYPDSPSGLPSIENALALMLNEVTAGRRAIDDVVRWMCEAPALVWDMVGKGRIEEGYDADLVLVDMERAQTVRGAEQATKCGWSPWDGVELVGWPVRTWVLGREAWADGRAVEGARGRAIAFDHARGGYWAAAGSP